MKGKRFLVTLVGGIVASMLLGGCSVTVGNQAYQESRDAVHQSQAQAEAQSQAEVVQSSTQAPEPQVQPAVESSSAQTQTSIGENIISFKDGRAFSTTDNWAYYGQTETGEYYSHGGNTVVGLIVVNSSVSDAVETARVGSAGNPTFAVVEQEEGSYITMWNENMMYATFITEATSGDTLAIEMSSEDFEGYSEVFFTLVNDLVNSDITKATHVTDMSDATVSYNFSTEGGVTTGNATVNVPEQSHEGGTSSSNGLWNVPSGYKNVYDSDYFTDYENADGTIHVSAYIGDSISTDAYRKGSNSIFSVYKYEGSTGVTVNDKLWTILKGKSDNGMFYYWALMASDSSFTFEISNIMGEEIPDAMLQSIVTSFASK